MVMTCPICAKIPEAHTFVNIGTLQNITLIYSSPARSRDYKESDAQFENMRIHLNSMKTGPWIWLFDCRGMQLKHAASVGFAQKLGKLLSDEHSNVLQGIYILHPNTWMKATIKVMKTMFKESMFKKLHLLEGEKLELYVKLESLGFSGKPLQWLSAVFVAPPEPGYLPALH